MLRAMSILRASAACFLLGAVGLLASCSKGGGAASEEGRGLGDVMADVGRRFEVCGRAAAANRFELAAYEADELGEIFENDVPHATLPKEGPTAQIPGLAKQFLQMAPPALMKAAQAKDPVAFAQAFGNTAGLCNACHQSAEKGFIQVPVIPGQAVPVLVPQPFNVPLGPPPPAPSASEPRPPTQTMH
jgi:hypothetical protein